MIGHNSQTHSKHNELNSLRRCSLWIDTLQSISWALYSITPRSTRIQYCIEIFSCWQFFPKIKFIREINSLMHSNGTKWVCTLILKWLNLNQNLTELKMQLWTEYFDSIDKFLTQHQYNVNRNNFKISNRK